MALKLAFDPKLQFQLDAVEAVCDLFRGREIGSSEFTVTSAALDGAFMGIESDLGIGNYLGLLPDEIVKNLNVVQVRNGLPQSVNLESKDFTIEMETGTGKTYVYLRTILELKKRYGFSKFIVVVPSVAIKEGVYKTLQITEEHFKTLYSGEPYNYFLYDSKKLGDVRNFATSSEIQIMVTTVGAINKKDVNNIYKESEKTGGERPIDLIQATNPILIIDEPQSVDGGLSGKGRKALDAMNPLCTLRYSATHVDKHHMVYRLNAVDAYQQKLVKQIEVAGAEIKGGDNKPYVRFVSTAVTSGTVVAKVEVEVETKSGAVDRKIKTVTSGDDLEQLTDRAIYSDHLIGEIDRSDGGVLELRTPGEDVWLTPGDAHGDVDQDAVDREMIRHTVEEHLRKAVRLAPKGLKVLSLFFVPEVALYRQYDEEGNAVPGEYVKMFEEEYERALKKPGIKGKLDADQVFEASAVHEGYFSIDRKRIGGKMQDVFADSSGATQKDESAYNLIMRDKERLLGLDEPLQFIFSHSALREGWDNPNVFQICTLRDIKSERQRRQTIGRGLRLCVNQDGERATDHSVNTLTVVARDSYEKFAADLQTEIEEETGIRFGVVEKLQFAACTIVDSKGDRVALGNERSEEFWSHLREEELIEPDGKVTGSLKQQIEDGEFDVPESFKPYMDQILAVLKRLTTKVEVYDARDRKSVAPKRAVLDSPEFKELWDRIKYKTTYRVEFDNEKLLLNCVKAVEDMSPVPKSTVQWTTGRLGIDEGGVSATGTVDGPERALEEGDIPLPDVLTDLQDRTALTRRSIHRIMIESGRLHDFKKNPQRYIEMVADIVNTRKRLALVDGIKYQRLGDSDFYAQELFETEELTGFITQMLTDAERCVYEDVVVDSNVERTFAEDLEKQDGVRVYAKLPGWFKVPTPLGSYNPDWAVLIEVDGDERLYFVVETKSSTDPTKLRPAEWAKIKCGKAHFEALASDGSESAEYVLASSLSDVLARA